MKQWGRWVIIGGIILVVVVFAFFYGRRSMHWSHTSQGRGMTEKKVLYWVAPMNPNYRSDKPGKSPMGMDLVPVYEEPDQAGTIQVNPSVENSIGVRTTKVKKQVIDQTIQAVGYVKPNDEAIESVNSYTDGWVKDLQVKTKGEKVSKGQLLFKLYSPEIISAQEEYLLAIKYHNSALQAAGKKKLTTLGVSSQEIAELDTAKAAHKEISVYAPINGYVTALSIKDGQHIMPNLSLMTIADLSKVWVMAEIFEKQAAKLHVGQTVTAHFTSLPGQTFEGTIDYIYPQLEAKTRTVKIRIVLDNPHMQLKPDMYANLTVSQPQTTPVLAVPKEALVRLGNTTRVILSLGDGKFRSVVVKTGLENRDLIQITQGLKAGDVIVTSSQFLLDSESSLKAGLTRMHQDKESDESLTSKAHQHDMSMNTAPPAPMTHQH